MNVTTKHRNKLTFTLRGSWLRNVGLYALIAIERLYKIYNIILSIHYKYILIFILYYITQKVRFNKTIKNLKNYI